MLSYITNSSEKDDLSKIDYEIKTKEFLLSKGMDENTINKLIKNLHK